MNTMSFCFLLLLTVSAIALASDSRQEEELQVQRKGICLGSIWACGGVWGRRDTEVKQRALSTSLASPGVLERDTQRRDPSLRRRGGWGDFRDGVSTGATIAYLFGRRNSQAGQRALATSLRSLSDRERGTQKRVHLVESAAGAGRAHYGAGEGKKRDDADADRVLMARNKFASAHKETRDEIKKKKRDGWHTAAGIAAGYFLG